MGPFGTVAKGSIVPGSPMEATYFMVPGLLERGSLGTKLDVFSSKTKMDPLIPSRCLKRLGHETPAALCKQGLGFRVED